MIDLSGYLNTRDAAKRLGIHEESFRRIVRMGVVRAEKIGGQWYIDKTQFDLFRATYDPKTGRRKTII